MAYNLDDDDDDDDDVMAAIGMTKIWKMNAKPQLPN
jgi:hypothetical protein